MPIIRASADHKHQRVFGFKAWHHGLNRMVIVKSCDFTDLNAMAELIAPLTGLPLRAKMKDLVLLQDTNMVDINGEDVFEGDLVTAKVMNVLGSSEQVVAEVVFDDENWGYNLKFDEFSGLPLTGEMRIHEIVGNVFEGLEKIPVKNTHEQEKRNEKG